jgi:hypothetical protein
MASRNRPGSAKRTVAKQEAARKRGARKAKPAEAARTAGRRRHAATGGKAAKRSGGRAPARKAAEAEAEVVALRASEADAALSGAEVEPLLPVDGAAAEPAAEPKDAVRRADADVTVRAVPADPWWQAPSSDVSAEHGGGSGAAEPPFGWAMAGLVRSALGLARTVVTAPLRLALAIPRLALRAVTSA